MVEEYKVAVVTGASRGIGFAIVRKLMQDGYNIAACVRSKNVELESLLFAHGSEGERHKIFEFDLSDRSNVKEAANKIGAWKGGVAALVNCAGMAQGSLFSMTRIEDLQKIFEINFFSQLLLTQILVKKMIRAKYGAVINVASTAGILADTGTLAYGCSKAALMHATKIMAGELGPYGIRVNAIAPSVVETDMANLMDEKARLKLDQRSALSGSIDPDDVANLVGFLVSEESRKITGQIIRIDRGMPF